MLLHNSYYIWCMYITYFSGIEANFKDTNFESRVLKLPYAYIENSDYQKVRLINLNLNKFFVPISW